MRTAPVYKSARGIESFREVLECCAAAQLSTMGYFQAAAAKVAAAASDIEQSGASAPHSRTLARCPQLFPVVIATALIFAAGVSARADETTSAALTPRQLYNEGTKKIDAGKLLEAETALQDALVSQDEAIQNPALYNLGEVRFRQGVEELKKQADAPPADRSADDAQTKGESAISDIDKALASQNMNEMVTAYLRGKGASKDLKAAEAAVKRAMESYAVVLQKWRRSSGDFRSAVELKPSDKDSEFNANAVDRHIARLIDLQKKIMMANAGVGKTRSNLRQKMQQLGQKIPKEMGGKDPGAGEDDDEDQGDQPPKEPQPGESERQSTNGNMRLLTLDEAERLLGMLRLDQERKLAIGMSETESKPKDRNKGRDW